MFNRSNRQRKSVETASIDGELIGQYEPSIERFLEENTDSIVDSAFAWHRVGESMRWISTDDRVVDAFNRGIEDCFKTTGVSFNAARAASESKRLIGTLGSYTQAVARSESSNGKGLRHQSKSVLLLTKNLPGPGIAYIFERPQFPRTEYLTRYLTMMMDMQKADAISDAVLSTLCSRFAVTPQHVSELNGLYQDGAEQTLPLLTELRAMITADWHRQDPDKSILRQHCNRLSEDPGLHIEPFCEAVGRGEKSSTVATMARYALLSSSPRREVTGSSVAKHLYESRAVWREIPDLQEAFNDYMEEVSLAIANDFNSIAGPRSLTNARLERSEGEVLHLATEMAVFATANNAEARQAKRQRQAQSKTYRKNKSQGGVELRLPSTNDAINQLDSGELLTQRSVSFARYANGRGYELIGVDELRAEDLLEKFGLERDQKDLAADMCSAIEYLRQPQHVKGVKRMQGSEPIRINGKQHRLWRLAPSHAPGLKINGNNRHYRVVYTVSGDKVIIFDVLSHANFDKKYK